ncbi:T9SS type B sorting domain-containing protein [Robertkochia aurantiaca]|uniref:T9SS type B sorting domain-containing protein n=1 Tax=Robertkochia aurantiaca TaxID=2873700 RepID=UPI001CCA5823|nr:T9SS type B sorting domain-containing protein [Robertkochia sp. 3YJGBD-33]
MTKNYLKLNTFLAIACLLLGGNLALKYFPEINPLAEPSSEKELLLAYNGDFGYIEDNSVVADFKAPLLVKGSESNLMFANEIKLIKEVTNATGGTLIGGASTGQEVVYTLTYENTSGSPINNYSITDVLPETLTLIGTDDPANSTYNTTTRELTINVGNLGPNASGTVLVRVRVTDEVELFRDSCTTLITNQAYSNYRGLSEPSFANGTDAAAAPTTFPVRTNNLNYSRTEAICGGSVDITAGTGFDTYRWTRNGAFVANTQTATLTQPGTYVITKTVDCDGQTFSYTETVNVYDASSIANPILPFADDVGICPNDGSQMPNLLLCGSEESRFIDTGYEDAVQINWQQQNASCTTTANCANPSNACWSTVASGSGYEVTDAGSYRVELVFQNGCRRIFYFNVYKDQLNATTSSTNYTPASLGSITINAGGTGPQYTYTISGDNGYTATYGPTTENVHTFDWLVDGTYDISVSSDSGCSYSETIVIEDFNPLWMETQGYNIKDCNRARIRIARGGGDPPYQFAIWSVNGVPRYDSFQDIPDSAFSNEESESTGGSQSRVYEILIEEAGDYVLVMRDEAGNFALSNIQTIELDPRYNFTVETQDVSCFGGTDGAVSLDFQTNEEIGVEAILFDGDTYVYGGENTPLFPLNASGTFPNLAAGDYVIEVTIFVKKGNSTCSFVREFTIEQPDAPLVAYAGVSTDVSCLPELGGSEIRITNASGGTPPYEYNINGTWTSSNTGIRSNDGYVYVRDANGCQFEAYVDVNALTEIPQITDAVDYNCDGTGNVVLTPFVEDPNLVYLYSYSLNGDIPQDSNSFESLAPGNYTITVFYENATPDNPTPGILLEEDFGTGPNTTLNEINPNYIYESQVQNQDPPEGDADRMLDDGEYVVTSALQPIGGQQWVTPSDADGVAGGRYLAVNIGDAAGEGGIIYSKQINDIVNGSDIMVDISVFNLLYQSSTQGDPEIIVEVIDGSGNVVSQDQTGFIDNDEQWHPVQLSLNSGGNSSLTFRIRSNSTVFSGNDIAIDGLRVYQVPEICTSVVEVPIVVEESQQFSGAIGQQNDVTCFGAADGSITFDVYNFDPAEGFEYSIDGGNTWTFSNTSPVTVNNLAPADYTIEIRNPVDDTCFFTMGTTAPIGQPQVLEVTSDVTQQVTCDPVNPGATIVAEATGGSAPYEYGIDDGSGAGIVWGTNNVFTNLPQGSYEIHVRDANGCEANTLNPVVLDAPLPLTFDATATTCYDGTNGEIVVTITEGNGDYQFSLDNSTWFNADSATPNTYTFTNLTPGTYDVYVRDGFSCTNTTQLTINPQIGLSVTSQSNVTCEGEVDGSATLTVTDFIPPYSYTVNGSAGGSGLSGATINLDNLTAGSYDVEVTDANGCTTTATVVIDAPATALDATLEVNDLTCSSPRGSVRVSATGGYGSYRYTLTLPDGSTQGPQNNSLFNNLTAPGDYTVTIEDAGGCIISRPFTLSNPVPPTLALSSAGCYDGTNNVTITATPSGGTAPFTYSLNGAAFQASNTFDVTPGNYTVTVRDALDCEATATITVDTQVQVAANAGVINSCGGTTNITATASGGDGNYVFAIVPAGNSVSDADFDAANNVLSVSAPGVYDVYVRDNSGTADYCEALTQVTVTQTAALDLIATPTDVTCFGGADGSVSLSATGGTAPYQYSLDNGTTYQNSPDFYNLTAGTYDAMVRDVNGCTFPLQVTVGEPDEIIVALSNTDYTCTADAEITVTASGGSGTLEYSLNGGAWQTSNVFTGVQDGTHTVRVRDANATSCFVEDTIIIAPLPDEPALSYAVTYNCDGTGEVTVTATPSDPSFTYSFDGGTFQASPVFSNILPGSYVVTVDYGSGCTTTLPVTIQAGEELTGVITNTTDVLCFGGSDGTVTFDAANYITSYNYEILDSGSASVTTGSGLTASATENNLIAGDYTLNITDSADPSCVISIPFTIDQPTAVAVVADVTTEATCNNGQLATIQATGSGGTPGYQYELQDASGVVVGSYAFSSNNTFTDVAPGDYIIVVRDSNGCETNTNISVNEPNPLEMEAIAADCYAGDNNGTITVNLDPNGTGAVGNGNVQVRLNGGPYVNMNTSPTSHVFSGLLPGSYTIDVRDAYGCIVTQSVIIEDVLLATTTVDDISCNDGNISVAATGGDGNYVFAIVPAGTAVSAGDFTTASSLTVTPGNAGDYDVYVRDNDGNSVYCEYTTTVTIDQYAPIAINLTDNQPACYNDTGSIELDITGGEGPYTIEFNDGTTTTTYANEVSQNRVFYNLAAGTYTITVTDSEGCMVTDSRTLINPEELTAVVDPIIGSCDDLSLGTGFGFEVINIPPFFTGGDYTIEYDDGTGVWQTSPVFDTYSAGDVVYPAVRVTHNVTGAVCYWEYGRFIIPYPLDDLNINVSAVLVSCTQMDVTVEGTQGDPGYEYTYTSDPADFDPLTATWTSPVTPLTGPHEYTFTNLIPGRTYVFYVRDTKGCIRQSTVNVNDLIDIPIVSGTATPSCAGSNNGVIDFAVNDTDGDLGSSFTWDLFDINDNPIESGSVNPFSSPDTFSTTTPLAPGEYYVILTGDNGCVYGAENVLIEELDPITGTPDVLQDITCEQNGLIEIQNLIGGGGDYTITLTSTDFVNPITSNDLVIEVPLSNISDPTVSSININVSVEDQFGCAENLGNVTMNIAQPPVIDAVVVDNCSVQPSITVNPDTTEGLAPYYYSIDGGATYQRSNVFTNVAPGIYDVYMKDSNGCTDMETVEVFPPLQLDAELVKPIDCNPNAALANGEITVDITGGSSINNFNNLTYTVILPNGTPDPSFNNVPVSSATITYSVDASLPGTYEIIVTDAYPSGNCPVSVVVEAPDRVLPNPTIDNITNVSCFGGSDGSITVSAADDGIGPFTFEIISSTDGTTTNSLSIIPSDSDGYTAVFDGLSGLETGLTYTIEVRSGSNFCETTIDATITQPAEVVLDPLVLNDFSCTSGNTTGVATVTATNVTGGTGAYTYVFTYDNGTPGNTSDDLTQSSTNETYTVNNLLGGTVSLTVYDENGCQDTESIVIEPFNSLDGVGLTAVQPTCNGLDGSIEVNAVLGLGYNGESITYELTQLDGSYTDNATLNAATHTFDNLDPGLYEVRVTNDDTGCFLTETIELVAPNTFELEIVTNTEVSCFGSATGSVTATVIDTDLSNGDDAGAFDYTLTSTNPSFATVNATSTGVSIDFNDLPEGDYTLDITLTGSPFCPVSTTFSIQGPSETLTATAVGTDPTCIGNDGVIEVLAQGGWGGYGYYVSQTPNPDPADASNYASTPRFDNLDAGTYDIWVIDQNGCAFEVPDITLVDPTPITADITATNPNCDGLSGEVTVDNVSGGAGSDYIFQLIKDGVDFGAPQYGMTALFGGLGAGEYEVRISDAWSCEVVVSDNIELFEEFTVSGNIDTDLSCDASNANTGGVITLSAIGGSGDFSFDAEYPDGSTVNNGAVATFTGLDLDGVYQFTVTDNITGCVEVLDIELTAPVIPAIDNIATTNVTCAGADGTIIVTLDGATETDPPYTYEISQGGSVLQSNTDGVFTGLDAGTYDVTVTSALGCFATGTAVIGTDPTPEIALDLTNNCTSNGGEVTVTLTQAGIAPYTLTVNGAVRNITFDANDEYVITGLTAGTYDIQITDANGCGYNATNVIDVTPLNYRPQITTLLDCEAGTAGNAVITIDQITGSGSYEIEIDGPNAADLTRTALPASGMTWDGAAEAGDYTITVWDLDGDCPVVKTVTVPERLEPQIAVIYAQDQTCEGFADGQIVVDAVDNGIGPFTFEITAVDGVATTIPATSSNGYTATFEGLAGSLAGTTYTITATAANQCEATVDQLIYAPEAVTITDVEVIPFACDAGSNVTNYAQVIVDPSDVNGGSGTYVRYEFVYNGSVIQNSSNPVLNFRDLAGGTVTVNVYDENGCMGTIDAVIPPFIGIENPQLTVDNAVTCVSGEDVTVSVDVIGGTANLQYFLTRADGTAVDNSPVTTDASWSFAGLAQGAYFVNIINTDTGCEVSIGHTVNDPNNFVLTAEESSRVSCFGTASGSVELVMQDLYLGDGDQSGSFTYTITGVTDPAFTLSGNSATNTIVVDGIPAGTFRIEATLTANGLNCTVPSSEFSIQQSLEPLSTTAEEIANVTCTNDLGEIYVNPQGGYAPYTIELLNNTTGDVQTVSDVNGYVFIGLSGGQYTATVTDAGGCEVTADVELITPEFISAEIIKTDVTCNGESNGSVTATNITGGAGADSYYFILNDITRGTTSIEQREPVFTDLPEGTYTITIYDAWSCDFTTEEITIEQPNEVIVSEISKSSLVCFGSNDGYIEVNAAGGTAPYSVTLNETTSGDEVMARSNITDADMVMFDGLSGDVEYTVFVTDANGCTVEMPFMIPMGPDLSGEATPNYACEANMPSNWVEVIFNNAELDPNELMVAINSNDINDAILFDEVVDGVGILRNLPAGAAQTLTVFYEGCSHTFENSFDIDQIDPVVLTDMTNPNEMNLIEVEATEGQAPYTFYFNDRNNGSDPTYYIGANDPGYVDEEGREIKVIEVTVIDANGCEMTITVEKEFIDVDIPNFFTPDGDGNNDTWGPDNTQNYPRILTKVYDRYGRVVGKMTIGQEWDGKYKGTPLPTGDYWYVIKLNGENDDREFVGHFTLYR